MHRENELPTSFESFIKRWDVKIKCSEFVISRMRRKIKPYTHQTYAIKYPADIHRLADRLNETGSPQRFLPTMHFSWLNATVISLHLHRAELSQIFTGWQKSQICLRAAAETLSSAAQKKNRGSHVPGWIVSQQPCLNRRNHISTAQVQATRWCDSCVWCDIWLC